MKILKQKLKQIIKEELEQHLFEDKQEHIEGIKNKIARLERAKAMAQKGMENLKADYDDPEDLQDIEGSNAYFAKDQEVINLERKIDLLRDQLAQLEQGEPLTRG